MTTRLMEDADFKGFVSYVLDVCAEAIDAGEVVTPLAIVARMNIEHGPSEVGVVNLSQAQAESNERVAEIVKELASRPEFDLCCFVAEGTVSSTDLAPNESALEARNRMAAAAPGADALPVVVTVVYSKEREAVGLHLLDRPKRLLQRGELEFHGPSQATSMSGALVRLRH